MEDLNDVRAEIDAIDDELVKLFVRRLNVSAKVAAAKRASGKCVTDPARERAIISRVTAEVPREFENGARLLFSTLFSISKARQRLLLSGGSPLVGEVKGALAKNALFPSRALVACCGTEGSYAQQAACRMFAAPTIAYFNSFENVFEAVEKGLCQYGMLPVENSAAGSVAAVYDLMLKHRFHIARALRLKIDHVLLAPHGVRLADVREVTSHPHALAQCKAFFRARADVRTTPAANTAVAARAVAESGRRDFAAVASRSCAELYDLDVVAEGIQDASYNYTRFICISKDLEIYPDANKFTVMLSLPHKPGALNAIISKFASIDVNLTKLESRPIPGMDFEFRFTFDFESTPSDEGVLALLAELAADPDIEHFDFLGAYCER